MTPILSRSLRRTVRKWKFSLHESEITAALPNNLGPANRLRWLRKARGKRIELILDKPGSISFNVPTKSIEAQDIKGYEIVRCVMAHAPDKNGVYQPIWSGPVWTAEADEPGGKLNVTCVGWDQLFEHREFRTDVNFVRATNGEMASVICRTASNQYANDGYGLGASAEDLLFGAGDFEDTGTFDASGQTWNFVGLLTMGDIFNWLGTGVYESIGGPDEIPPSGAKWFRTTLRGVNAQAYAWISSRQGLVVEGRNVGFAVEPNTPYRVDGIYHVMHTTGTGQGALQVRWYDAAGVFISTTQILSFVTQGIGGEFGYANEDTQIDASVLSPATAARAAVVLGCQTGTAVPGGAAGGNDLADILWDNIVFTKANDANRIPFIIRSNKDDPYIENWQVDPSFEGTTLTNWIATPGTVTRAFSTEWATSGIKSMKVTQLGVITTGDYGLRTTAGFGSPSSPVDFLYIRVNVNVVKAGKNGTFLRYRRGNLAGNVVFDTYNSQVLFGTGQREFEVYMVDMPPQTVGTDTWFEVVSSALPGDDVQFYMDDVTLVADEPVPIPFYEGSLANARWLDKDSLGRPMHAIGPVFTRSYTRGTKLSQVLTEMTEIEWGVDYQIDPVTRKLKLFWDSILPGTSLRGRGTDRRNVIFGYGTHPHNVASVRDAGDASKTKDRVNTEGKVGRGLAQDLDQIARIGLFEETIQMTDVADPPPPSPSILAVYAGAEVTMFSAPFRTITFQPKRYVTGENVPMFGVDYDLGDLTTLKADKNVTKVGMPGGHDHDNPPKIYKRIDDFKRNGQSNVGVETFEGQFIWAPTDYFGAANLMSVTRFGNYAYGENSVYSGGRLMNKYGPDWDFAWMIDQPLVDAFIDFYWGSTVPDLTGTPTVGVDYHSFRYMMAPTGNSANDVITIDADAPVNVVTAVYPGFSSFAYIWFQKRGTTYNIYRQYATFAGSDENTSDRKWLGKAWTLLASFEKEALADVESFIGLAQGKTPRLGFLHGGTWQSRFANFESAPGQTMRVFGANISFDDNTDGENIESLTTMLGG